MVRAHRRRGNQARRANPIWCKSWGDDGGSDQSLSRCWSQRATAGRERCHPSLACQGRQNPAYRTLIHFCLSFPSKAVINCSGGLMSPCVSGILNRNECSPRQLHFLHAVSHSAINLVSFPESHSTLATAFRCEPVQGHPNGTGYAPSNRQRPDRGTVRRQAYGCASCEADHLPIL